MSVPIKILIVDDSTFFRNALKLFLKSDYKYQIIGEANNGIEFLELLNSTHPDIVLMDIKMPIMDGATATKQALFSNNFLKIIGLSMHEEFDYLKRMIEAGAKGYIYKNSVNDNLKIAIDTVMNGEYFFQN
ncbi:MAG: response regulator transcription factor [Salinivirgaceae bacterium]|nr:response regulator transcription factor [Salinivirgaceae bacterium]